MEFLNSILHLDQELLLFLHSLGSTPFDGFWIFITNPFSWIPLLFLIYFAGYKVFGFKKATILFILTLVCSSFALGIVNLIKNWVQRLRPLNDISINESIRTIISASDFSFVSGHSTVSFTIAFLTYWLLKQHYKMALLVFIFPLLFAYSRIYLALHYPLDIFCGMLLAYGISIVFYKTYLKFSIKSKTI